MIMLIGNKSDLERREAGLGMGCDWGCQMSSILFGDIMVPIVE